MNIEKIQKRIDQLKKFLSERPDEAYYMGDGDNGGDWVEQENRHNEQLAESVEAEIKRLEGLLKQK